MTDDAPDDATDLRSHYRALRRAVGGPERLRAARAVDERIRMLTARRAPGTVGAYLPTDGELDPTLAVDSLRDTGWQVHLPVLGPGRSMRFAEWPDGGRLEVNRYGIEEPAGPTATIATRELDLVLLPCVAVDPAGTRFGFGAGYYDRALATGEDPAMVSSRPRPLLVGTVFDLQLAPRLTRESWDVPLDVVVCESATLFSGARTLPSGW